MVTFQVNDMTCGHCASAISRAVASVDKNARMDIRIQQKLVRVSSTSGGSRACRTADKRMTCRPNSSIPMVGPSTTRLGSPPARRITFSQAPRPSTDVGKPYGQRTSRRLCMDRRSVANRHLQKID